jgi:hypothetical protein
MLAEPSTTPTTSGSDRAEQLQFLLVVAGEMLWLLAWSVVAGHWLTSNGGAPLLPIWAVIGLAVSAGLSRWLDQRRTTRAARLGLALGGLVLAVISGLSTLIGADGIDWAQAWRWLATGDLAVRPLATIGLTLLAWWRGLVLGQLLLSLDEVEGAFRRAVGALVLLALLNAVTPAPQRAPATLLIWPAIGVLTTGLLSLPMSRLIDVRLAARRGGGAGVRLDRQWLGLLLTTIGVLIAVALVVVSIVSFERLDTLFGWLRQPLDLLIDVFLAIVVLPIAYLLDLLVTFLRQFIQPNQPLEQESGAGERTQPPLAFVVPPDLEWIFVLLRGLLALGLVVGIVAFLASALLRFAARDRPDDVDEERDFVFSWGTVRTTLRDWFTAWLGRLRPARPRAAMPTPSARPVPPRAQWGPRDLYRALLRLGAVAGRPRSLVETPNEYAGVLRGVEALHESQHAIATVTELYAQTEYGHDTPSATDLAAGQAALATLEAAMTEPSAVDER